jgi:MFS family permease
METSTATPATPATPGKKPGILINRNFGLLFGGSTISAIGDFVFTTTLVLWIAVDLAAGQSWAPLAVAGVLVAAAVPVLLLGPLAGVFVDRWNKRATMLVVNIVQAVVVAALLGASGIVPLPFLPGGQWPVLWTLGAIYAVVFLVNAANQFQNPAAVSLIGDIVAEEHRPRAMGLIQAMAALATIIGPPLAAPLLFAFGVQWALIIDAGSFLVAFAAVLLIRAPKAAVSVAPGQRGHFWREFGQGLAFFARSRVLVTLVIAASLVMLGGGALNALDVFFVTGKVYLNQPATLYGYVGGVMGFGALAGAILAGTLANKVGLTRLLWLSLVLGGILVMVWARMTVFIPALVVLFLIGIVQAGLNVAVGPIMLDVTPRELVGRIVGILEPIVTLASLISIALAGYLDSTVLNGFHATVYGIQFHAVDTIFLAAGVLLLLGGLYAAIMLRGVQVGAPPPAEAAPVAATEPVASAAS